MTCCISVRPIQACEFMIAQEQSELWSSRHPLNRSPLSRLLCTQTVGGAESVPAARERKQDQRDSRDLEWEKGRRVHLPSSSYR